MDSLEPYRFKPEMVCHSEDEKWKIMTITNEYKVNFGEPVNPEQESENKMEGTICTRYAVAN